MIVEGLVEATETDGRKVYLRWATLAFMEDVPSGGTRIGLAGGHVIQVKETRQELIELADEAF